MALLIKFQALIRPIVLQLQPYAAALIQRRFCVNPRHTSDLMRPALAVEKLMTRQISKHLSIAVLLAGLCALASPSYADDSAKLAALEARLQLLEDREAIRDLLVTYGHLLDEKDLAGYSKLFSEDGVWEGGIGSATGPAGIYAMLDTVFKRVEPGSFGNDYHIMSDFIIHVDGDTATSRSNWTWVIEGKEGTPVAARSGHYEDKLVRIDGAWKFRHRLTVTELPVPEKDVQAQIFRKDHRDSE